MSPRFAIRISVAAALIVLMTGCTRIHRSYPERSADEVWTAARAVAEEPRYDDWVVIENAVHADSSTRRIEIYRELRRDLALPATKIQREDRTYRFRITVADATPAEVTFTSRGWAVPAHAHSEGMRFLDELEEILGGMPLIAPTPPPAPPSPPVAPPPPPPPPPSASPPVDIDLD